MKKFKIKFWCEGRFVSHKLLEAVNRLYPDHDREDDEGYALHHVQFAYTVYAMQYGLWQFRNLGLCALSDANQIAAVADVHRAFEIVFNITRSEYEFHLIEFLHRWHFQKGRPGSNKWVISQFKCGCKYRLLFEQKRVKF